MGDDTRERLARAACYGDDQLSSGCRCTDEAGCIDWTAYEQVVDAILAEQAVIEREKSDA